jgi:ABC-type dipeptide/oligopeptide/nickel transport system permease component
MGTFLIRRLMQLVFVVLAALTLMFFLFFALPGDPAELLTGTEGKVPEATLAQVRERYDLDKPLVVQYGKYMGRVAQWDLGESFKDRQSVNEILGRTAKASIRLGFWAITIEVVLGIATGLYSAVKRYSFRDAAVTVSTAAASAVPVYVLGLLLQQMLGVFPNQHGLPTWLQFPTGSIGPDSWALFVIPTGNQWEYLVLPALTLASVSTAVVARLTRTMMLEVERADYMRTARAKGLTERTIILRHGLRNALIPVVTFIAIDIGTVIGVAVLTETVYGWPGMGSRIARAVAQRDFAVVLGLGIVVTLLYALANLLADVAYAWLDPRVRLRGKAGSR